MPRILLLGLSTVAAIFMTTDTAQAQTAGWLERSVDREVMRLTVPTDVSEFTRFSSNHLTNETGF